MDPRPAAETMSIIHRYSGSLSLKVHPSPCRKLEMESCNPTKRSLTINFLAILESLFRDRLKVFDISRYVVDSFNMRTRRMKVLGAAAVYHCMTHTVSGTPYFDQRAKEVLGNVWQVAAFSGVEVLLTAS